MAHSSSALRKPVAAKPPSAKSPPPCRHSPAATLDILIFVLVLFSGAFLILSYFSYLFKSLTLILPPFSTIVSQLHYHMVSNPQAVVIFFVCLVVFFVTFLVSIEICFGHRSRRCGRKACRGLKKSLEFDLQLQGEDMLRIGDGNKAVRDVNQLPWKGGSEFNPDYDCLRIELRKMAPPNGRAVLLFRDKCGCPVAKLEGWGPKRGRRHKKSMALISGGGDHP
ncbi:uncharacterized protein At5g19025-like [Andrographis paniculata]|uniref:uncharacterized protein At5g19025-like n=1 Tax=Andrographis paniculata TaxID=175694 RepID=UPI0021E7262E|nr:uncharacterized protein At5g19025-like [Andrographis paniculata]XP_051128106.1 uncharacterized protein At5g19025-like [Andrographis paniculata]